MTMINSSSKSRKSLVLQSAAALMIVLANFLLLYWSKGYAPFGSNSLAYMDADIQYLDFYSYLKEVFAGNDSILYSYGKTLGGSNVAVFSYYLSSPFDLLILLFDKGALNTFFDLTVALKLGTAAITFCCFLHYRFHDSLGTLFSVILSVSYAMMQYSIAQCSNVMWLDGVYMLPLILLGVYHVTNGKKPYLLTLSTGLAILFNWYSAGIDCIFSGFWFFLEYLLAETDMGGRLSGRLKRLVGRGCVYVASMLWGVALSSVLFLPSALSLRSGGRGSFQWDLVHNVFNGSVASTIEGFILGSTSSSSSVALFCGSFALLGCITLFTAKGISAWRKVILGVFLTFAVTTVYWQPFFFLFSMFRMADSYWFRYSYIILFSILFIAAGYYTRLREDSTLIRGFFRNAVIFSAILLIVALAKPLEDLLPAYYTVGGMLLVAACFCLRQYFRYHKAGFKRVYAIFTCLLLCVSNLEILYNSSELFDTYHTENAQAFTSYTEEVEKQISAIKESDSSNYRISQTANRGTSSENLTAYYNESLAYHYMSISGYTSDPDNTQLTFLDKLGYRANGERMDIVNTSILPTDSLLGVKYVLSPYKINGLEKLDSFIQAAGKDVYYNPYCLPMAFVYSSSGEDLSTADNPFDYQELLYSELLGSSADIYQRLTAEKVVEDGKIRYTLQVPSGNYTLYGNLPWEWETISTITIGDYRQAYSRWASPSVFYIPTEYGQAQVEIIVESTDDNLAYSILDEQFYALNLDRLAEVTQELLDHKEAQLSLETQYISCTVEAKAGESLYLSIPYHQGWTITRNGEKIEGEKFADCLYSIPLVDGVNTIEMEFTVPLLKEGAIVSCVSWLALIALLIFNRRKSSRCVENRNAR